MSFDKDKYLTKDITLGMMTRSDVADKWIEPSKIQENRLRLLAELVQRVINGYGGARVTSGLRDEDVYDALLQAGYHPSMSSDHFCGNVIRGASVGTGAVDFVPIGAEMPAVFDWLIRRSGILFGECKLSRRRGRWDHIHLSLPRLKILRSVDGKVFRIGDIY